MRGDNFKDLFRKSIHSLWIFVFLIYIILERFSNKLGLIFIMLLLSLSIILDILRVDLKHKFWYSKFLHKSESVNLSTPSVTLIGILIVLLAFPKLVAYTSILMMIFGDLASGISDIFLKSSKIFNKNISSIFIGFIVNLIIAFSIISPYFIGFFMALTASIMEMSSTKINDNLTIPLFSGLVGYLLFLII